MSDNPPHTILIVMGVSGSGKSTLGAHLAGELGWDFLEGDALHPQANIKKMRFGTPLTDEDRAPWLSRIASWVAERATTDRTGVVTCSALKRAYRDQIRGEHAVIFVHVQADPAVIRTRMSARKEHFMPPQLLTSQLKTLEPLDADEPHMDVDAERSLADESRRVIQALGLSPRAPF